MDAKILYIEDNPMNMRLVRKMLKMGGFGMFEAISGTSGLEMAEQIKPDIILLDINLHDIDGTEVTTRLKQNHELQHIPIIAVTANAMYGDRERFLEAGCDGYLSKPLNRQVLLETVEGFLDKQKT
ncbi:MAG: response regulator [Anaerolineae bacterium]|nr:response regulator [Anaerolineae bacterium]